LRPFERSNFLLDYRLLRHQLRPLDVGGGGDCFFKSVSHLLYGDSSHHSEIRTAGIQYLRENPERFIESNTSTSWIQYLSNMSMQGTWADNIIIQAVADSMNLKINVVESNENFAEITLVQGVDLIPNHRTIYLGHIGDTHYVSTLPATSQTSSNEICSDASQQNPIYLQLHQNHLKRKKQYMCHDII